MGRRQEEVDGKIRKERDKRATKTINNNKW
jgi:hypothetical protein